MGDARRAERLPPRHRAGRRGLSLATATAWQEVGRRAPWMLVSVVAGAAMLAVGQGFEQSLAGRIQLVFFLPAIVYMSDIIGTETLALVVRELAFRRVRMHRLFRRELLVGIILGAVSGVPMGLIGYLMFRDPGLAVTVGLAMSVNGAIAVLLGLLVPVTFARLKRDPAIGSDEIMTALSDVISMTLYLAIASLILFS